jgi:hypothetical protein
VRASDHAVYAKPNSSGMECSARHTQQNSRRKTPKLMQRQTQHSNHVSKRSKPNAKPDDEPNGASVSNPATQFNVKEVIAIERDNNQEIKRRRSPDKNERRR